MNLELPACLPQTRVQGLAFRPFALGTPKPVLSLPGVAGRTLWTSGVCTRDPEK